MWPPRLIHLFLSPSLVPILADTPTLTPTRTHENSCNCSSITSWPGRMRAAGAGGHHHLQLPLLATCHPDLELYRSLYPIALNPKTLFTRVPCDAFLTVPNRTTLLEIYLSQFLQLILSLHFVFCFINISCMIFSSESKLPHSN